MYDQRPYGLKDQMVSHSSVLFGTVSSNQIGIQAFVLLYSRLAQMVLLVSGSAHASPCG